MSCGDAELCYAAPPHSHRCHSRIRVSQNITSQRRFAVSGWSIASAVEENAQTSLRCSQGVKGMSPLYARMHIVQFLLEDQLVSAVCVSFVSAFLHLDSNEIWPMRLQEARPCHAMRVLSVSSCSQLRPPGRCQPCHIMQKEAAKRLQQLECHTTQSSPPSGLYGSLYAL